VRIEVLAEKELATSAVEAFLTKLGVARRISALVTQI
jgi:hypothetical protein